MKFEFENRHYDLEFNSMVIQIIGESAVPMKSLRKPRTEIQKTLFKI